jgi:hypothetical protein
MTWNWYTVGTCFVPQSSWQVMSLKILLHLQQKYDARCRRVDLQAYMAISTETRASELKFHLSPEQGLSGRPMPSLPPSP